MYNRASAAGLRTPSIILGTILALLAACRAQSPSNDDFSAADELTGAVPIAVTGSNVGATLEAGEPEHDGGVQSSSVWWRWQAPATGDFSVDTLGSDFDTVLAVYEGASLETLTPVASDDEGGISSTSLLLFTAQAGTTYHIAVTSWAESPPGTIALRVSGLVPPPNDDFANSSPVTGPLPVGLTEPNFDLATVEFGEPNGPGGPVLSASAWWSWTAANSEDVAASAVNGFNQAFLDVFTGTDLNGLTPLPGASSFTGSVQFSAVAGTTYHLRVSDNGFDLQAPLELTIRPFSPPANDDLANAAMISQGNVPFSVTGTLVDATIEPGEPFDFGNPPTAWWKWTPGTTQKVEIASRPDENSMYYVAPSIGVFTGASVATLSRVAGNDYGNYTNFLAEAGTDYFIRAIGDPFNSPADLFQLAFNPGPPAPQNDLFENAEPLTGLPTATVDGTLLGAGVDPADPSSIDNVWYRWTAPSTSIASLSVINQTSALDSKVFTGPGLATLTEIPDARFGGQFQAVGGTTYHILIEGRVDRIGGGPFSLQIVPPPPNDNFVDRQSLSAPLPFAVAGTMAGAGPEGNEFTPTVWYEWTATSSGRHTVAVRGADTFLSVLTGNSHASLEEVPGAEPHQRAKSIWFNAISGMNYKIGVSSYSPSAFSLGISPPPINDAFASAIQLPAPPTTTSGDLVGATFEQDGDFEPSVWWKLVGNGESLVITSSFDDSHEDGEPLRLDINEGFTLDQLIPLISSSRGNASFYAEPGVTYYLRSWVRRPVVTRGDFTIGVFTQPSNDDFAGATLATTTGFTQTTHNGFLTAATREDDETRGGARHVLRQGRNSVWWEWVAPDANLIEIDTFGSASDTILSVFTGDQLTDLELVRACDDAAPDGTSRVAFFPDPGTSYRIRISSASGTPAGAYTLNLQQHPAATTAADHLLHGRAHLEGASSTELAAADSHFASARSLAPGDQEATVLRAITRFTMLQQQAEFATLMSQWGFTTKRANLRNPRHLPPRDADSNPSLPAGASTDQGLAYANATVLPELARLENDLSNILDQGFSLRLSDAESRLRFMEVDWADVRIIRAIGFALQAAIHFANTWNASFDVESLVRLADGDSLNTEELLKIGAQFLKRKPGDERQQLKDAVQMANSLYQPAFDFVKARPTSDGSAHLFYVVEGLEDDAQERADDIADAASSLDGIVTWDGVQIDLSAFLDTDVDLRDLMPMMRKNRAIKGTAPDPSMDGAVPAGTLSALETFLAENHLLYDISSFLAFLDSTLPDASDEERDPRADDDGDNLDLFTEWVFDLDPTSPNSEREILAVGLEPDPGNPGQQRTTITFVRLRGVPGLTYTLRVSDDLIQWDDSEIQVELVGLPVIQPDGLTEQVTYRLITPPGFRAKKYMSIRVHAP